ncbi:hypothetical protein VNI00_001522 [Paramarasmius palmivorus]|uniref:Eukaryotic translation initiation factor 3 subunit H n=1 Tax=Paramarasmius palmivorus TaxID=297713 RepID=A0AAW0E120_9AGAR
MAAQSMAAAIAATLPAVAATPAPAAPTYEAIPASMSKVIDVEAEIPLQAVQLDGLVVSKIMKHARDSPSTSAHGLLLGLDLDGTLEVSNSFPLPHHIGDEDEKSGKSVARYQASMLRALKEVQSDDGVVGFYQTSSLGTFFSQSLVDTQAIHQEKLRHGGVVVVHDVSQTARGSTSFRAFRLTSAFLDAYKKKNFSTASLASHQLTFSTILEEIPLKIRTNPLLNSFLGQLSTPARSPISDATPEQATISALPPSFDTLNLTSGGITKTLEQISEVLDNYRTEGKSIPVDCRMSRSGNVGYTIRSIAREKAKAEAYVAKRREENAERVSKGLVPLPEEDVNRLFKIPAEPSRLDGMLLLGQLDALAKNLGETSSTSLVKLYGSTAGSG